MKIVRGTYENGAVHLDLPPAVVGPVPVDVVFLDEDDKRWDELLDSPKRRPALEKAVAEALRDDAAGRSTPLTF